MGDMVVIDEQVFTDIADAIRNRNGKETTYKPREMADAVENLHNVRVKKWVRPSDWPDYSKVDLTDQEVIYLTYDCTYDNRAACFLLQGAYTVTRGQIDSNGTFVASAESTNVNSNSIFTEYLPTDEGDYVVYKIEPQEGQTLYNFRFRNRTDPDASATIAAWYQPCIERYANLPNITGNLPGSNSANETWTTRYMIADTVQTMKPTSMQNIYNSGSYIVEYIDYSKCSFSNVTTCVNMFYNQNNLIECYLPHDLSNKCTTLQNAFQGCRSLIYLDLFGWDTSGVTVFTNAFYGCVEIVEIKGLDNFDLTSATTLYGFLVNCNMLRHLDTSNWKTTDKLTNVHSCFDGCRQLRSIDVSGFVTDNVTDFAYCFSSCRNLETIDVSTWNVTSKATSLAGLFGYSPKLKTIIRNKNWDTSNVTSFQDLFREDRELQEIDLSDFDFSKTNNVHYIFLQCHSLRKIKANMDLALVTNKTNVQDFANQCWMLEDLSELSITNSTYMPAFGYCYSILYFRMPVVSTLADSCLRDMNHCRVFDFRDYTSVPTLNTATDITNGMNNYLIIVVPYDLFDAWVSATNWSNALLRNNIITEDDYDYYVNPSSTFTNIDLSQYTWSKCSGSNLSAADGVVYSSTISTAAGTGTMVTTTAPIELPANTTVYININDGYQYKLFYFDSNKKHIQVINKDNFKSWFFVSNSAVGSIGLVISKTDGSNIAPEDWADSGITVFYQR